MIKFNFYCFCLLFFVICYLQEAEAKKLKEEKEKRELEEYLKMKEAFEIEEEGLERDLEEEEESQHLLEEFINYIKVS